MMACHALDASAGSAGGDFMKSPIRRHVQAGLERRGSLLRIRYAPRRDRSAEHHAQNHIRMPAGVIRNHPAVIRPSKQDHLNPARNGGAPSPDLPSRLRESLGVPDIEVGADPIHRQKGLNPSVCIRKAQALRWGGLAGWGRLSTGQMPRLHRPAAVATRPQPASLPHITPAIPLLCRAPGSASSGKGVRHRSEDLHGFFFCGTRPCVYDTLGTGGLPICYSPLPNYSSDARRPLNGSLNSATFVLAPLRTPLVAVASQAV